jgi:hypothetical protein
MLYSEYIPILDNVVKKWLGDDSADKDQNSYRMLALLLDDPWVENSKLGRKDRLYIVDITKPEIQRKLDLLNGPYFNTLIKILELRMLDEENECNNDRTKNSLRTLV